MKSPAQLERATAYILLFGVLASLAVEALGLLGYVNQNSLVISFTPQWQTGGKGFFGYAWSLFSSLPSGGDSVTLVALGIILLMLTPYVRVVASFVYFASQRNVKYVLVTAFVLAVLTGSLLLYRTPF
jgi:uncharacterized membrane protein